MKSLLYYLLQMIVASGILYGYYHFVLRNKRFHHYNRFYLLAAMVISIAIPFLNIPVYFTHEQTNSSVVLHGLTVFSFSDFNEGTAQILSAPARMNLFTWENILYSFYILIASLILFRIIFSLKKIRTISKNNPVEEIENIHFVNTDEPGTPFSFFRWLFWNRKIELRSEKGEQIFRHELFHIEQKHSQDIIFTELLTVIFWINPFFHLIKKELKAIHEFLADEFAVKENEKWEYAELLLMQAFNTQVNLTNPFFHNQIKRRIAMITSSNKPKYQYLRKILVLPIAAIVVALFAFSYKMKNVDKPNTAEKPIVVVIDAGHGGSDVGAIASDGTLEKDIVLAIAQKVKSLNKDENVKIILTRNADVLPDLKSRTELSNNEHADLFLSIHVNTATVKGTTGKNPTGIDIYIPKKNKTFYSENRILASLLLNYFSQLYAVDNSIKQTDKAWVLENSNCPSALIECGYISNKKDLSFMKNPVNQEKIANVILQTIDQYATQKSSDDWEIRKKDVIDTLSVFSKLSQTGRNTVFYDSKRGFAFKADSTIIKSNKGSIILKSDTTVLHTNFETALLIINGKKKKLSFLAKTFIIAKTVIVYPTNDNETIKKFGPDAKNGVIVFENARIENIDNINNLMTDTTKSKIENDGKIFTKVEVEASFPGGEQAWKKYLHKNLNASTPVDHGAPSGTYTVFIQFIVDQDGYIHDLKALTHHGHGMEDEVVRIISKGPRWVPAMQNGHKVTAYRKQPVTFMVTEENGNSKKKIKEVTLTDTSKPQPSNLSKPLIIIDGVQKPNSNLSLVDPMDIESINVLKDAAAIAKYGDKGKNGVIEIFTKPNKDVKITSVGISSEATNENIKSDDNDAVFTKADIPPSFPGGDSAWKKYLQKALNPSTPVEHGAPEGTYRVIAQFIVDTAGFIHDLKALTHFGYGMEDEVIRILKLGPTWIPAMQNRRKVNAYVKQPVTFVVTAE